MGFPLTFGKNIKNGQMVPCPTKDAENTSHSGGHSGEQILLKTKSTRICVDQIETNLSIFVCRKIQKWAFKSRIC